MNSTLMLEDAAAALQLDDYARYMRFVDSVTRLADTTHERLDLHNRRISERCEAEQVLADRIDDQYTAFRELKQEMDVLGRGFDQCHDLMNDMATDIGDLRTRLEAAEAANLHMHELLAAQASTIEEIRTLVARSNLRCL